jgi:7-carboxy-7-deazaguanine synthase
MSKFDPNKLFLTSDFYTVQGEGISIGIPAYFIRLGVCNLNCGMSKQWFNQLVKINNALPDDRKMPDGEIFMGDLHQEGKATWTCDSTSQWALRGENTDFDYLLNKWKKEGLYNDLLNGVIHIIWTGGEPTIPQHQKSIVNFIEFWVESEKDNPEEAHIFQEIETNGTFYIEDDLFLWLNQINCSPKLSNSGMNASQRIKPEAIKRIMEHKNYQFKFVISNEEDVQEIFRDFVVPFNIPLSNVVCMPGLDDAANFEERTRFVLEMAKKYRFRGLTRLHIAAWNKTLNV